MYNPLCFTVFVVYVCVWLSSYYRDRHQNACLKRVRQIQCGRGLWIPTTTIPDSVLGVYRYVATSKFPVLAYKQAWRAE